MLIYNLLKREIIQPKSQADEMWFCFGKDQASFGREEFCLCRGLNMGTPPKGFREKKEVGKDSFLSRFFEGKRYTVELLEATFQGLTDADGDDALKLEYLLMNAAKKHLNKLRGGEDRKKDSEKKEENEEKNKKKKKKKKKDVESEKKTNGEEVTEQAENSNPKA
ncbi:hypothetical protein Dsin_012421 [Dipteronia sinensis]|uniref:Uncharacterized protein n=1 Tax=Dipteronia sinensis TaxID=43782 RepID=A0AAE0E804_9ROSI|nr:hypothetical protein Dsin_012421 [Dipteronia sinensis]